MPSPLELVPTDFRGEKYQVGDDSYVDARRIWNMRHDDWSPALIVRPADVADLQMVMLHAFKNSFPVAVRSGGHGIDATAMPHGELVVDLSSWKDIHVDHTTCVVRAGAGTLLGDLDAACQEHGLVVPSGTVSHTGIAGLTLGGGLGYNMRRFGATVDNLLACDVVTTDGRFIRASESENQDLFWALRGGGGNFGVVTCFEYRAHPLGSTPSLAMVLVELDEAKSMLQNLRGYVKFSRRELILAPILMRIPQLPGIPAEHYGHCKMLILCVFTGPSIEFDGIVAEISGLGTPSAVLTRQMPWVAINSILDKGAPVGRRYTTRGGYFSALTDDFIDLLLAVAKDAPVDDAPDANPAQFIWLFDGGALTRDFDEDSVAFSRQGAVGLLECTAGWDNPASDSKVLSWMDNLMDSVRPFLRPNGYINLSEDQGPEWLRNLYGSPEKYARLVAAKKKWDPKNLLRFNKNIEV